MPSAGSDTVSTEEVIYEDSVGCTTFRVHCQTGSAVAAMVHVDGLHAASEFFTIPAGEAVEFTLNHMGIRKVTAKGNAGTATINFGIVSRTMV